MTRKQDNLKREDVAYLTVRHQFALAAPNLEEARAVNLEMSRRLQACLGYAREALDKPDESGRWAALIVETISPPGTGET